MATILGPAAALHVLPGGAPYVATAPADAGISGNADGELYVESGGNQPLHLRPYKGGDAYAVVANGAFGNTLQTMDVNGNPLNVLDDSAGNLSAAGNIAAGGHINAAPSTPTLPANPPASGTVYQNTTGGPLTLVVPITGTAAGGSAQLALGSSSTPPPWGGPTQIGTLGDSTNVTLRIPNQWYWSLTVTNAAIGTANVLGE